ncbi:WD40 repeat-like protein [Dichomitus squalens LYAD-421 SS1]|uniref:WD40 repeat-like protein n=1 Tax=Dichomitus squalens (strain LYAD-421) TaxID=732165 RepID=R7SSM4_DICSQ|nr:WD40 repeat-like protein [Dichomitus squalens LYAD-421 SS1]EJF58710.1 WD40 repeat-like protein [Dichomitus squalens LYAD-421 SS1]
MSSTNDLTNSPRLSQSQPSTAQFPALPWEVIERVIELCSSDKATLCAFALTCSQLHPRSLYVLFSNVEIQSAKQLKTFYDAVQAQPRLQPLVRSLSFPCEDFSPFPLLSILPGLRHLTFDRMSSAIGDTIQHSQSTLLGRQFQTQATLLRFLSAFPNVEILTCEELSIDPHAPLREALEKVLLRYPARRVLLAVSGGTILNARKTISWSDEFNKCFRPLGEQWALADDVRYSGKPGHDSHVTALVVASDGRWVATASTDSTIILWDARDVCISQEWFARDGEVWDLAFSPDSRHLASAGEDGAVAIWDISGSAHQVASLEGHPAAVTSCAWSSDGAWIASRDRSRTIRLWDGRTFQPQPLGSANERAFIEPLFSPDSRWLFVHHVGKCGVWDVLSGAYLELEMSPTTGSDRYPVSAAFSRPSARVAVGYGGGTIRVLDTGTRQELMLLKAHEDLVRDVAFSPDGQLLLSASDDETMKVWDAHTGAVVQSLMGHEDPVRSVCFSPSGKYVVSTFDEGAMPRVWRTSDGSCFATLSDHGCWVSHVAFSPDGTMLWSGAVNGTVLGRRLQDIVPDEFES